MRCRSQAVRQAFALGVASIALVGCLASASERPRRRSARPSRPSSRRASIAGTDLRRRASAPRPTRRRPSRREPPAGAGLQPIVEGLDRPVAVASPDDGSGDLYVVEQAGRILRLPAGSGQARGRPRHPRSRRQRRRARAAGPGLPPDGRRRRAPVRRLHRPATATRSSRSIGSPTGGSAGAANGSCSRSRSRPPTTTAVTCTSDPTGCSTSRSGTAAAATAPTASDGTRCSGRSCASTSTAHRTRASATPSPADNPFVGQAGVRPEIWATGLRNPWRFSIEPGTGALWIGDVGASTREEIDYAPRAAWTWLGPRRRHVLPTTRPAATIPTSRRRSPSTATTRAAS